MPVIITDTKDIQIFDYWKLVTRNFNQKLKLRSLVYDPTTGPEEYRWTSKIVWIVNIDISKDFKKKSILVGMDYSQTPQGNLSLFVNGRSIKNINESHHSPPSNEGYFEAPFSFADAKILAEAKTSELRFDILRKEDNAPFVIPFSNVGFDVALKTIIALEQQHE